MVRVDPIQRSEQAGTRPFIVISRDSINHNAVGTNRSIVIVGVPTTDRSNLGTLYPSHVELKKGAGGLTLDSVALCEQIRAISVSRIVRYMGSLPEQSMRQIERALQIVLLLSRE